MIGTLRVPTWQCTKHFLNMHHISNWFFLLMEFQGRHSSLLLDHFSKMGMVHSTRILTLLNTHRQNENTSLLNHLVSSTETSLLHRCSTFTKQVVLSKVALGFSLRIVYISQPQNNSSIYIYLDYLYVSTKQKLDLINMGS